MPPSNSQAIAERLGDKAASPEPATAGPTVRELVYAQRGKIAEALPRHVNADRFMRLVFTQMRQTPKLMDCTAESLISSIIQCAQLGLEPGPLGHVYLLPFDKKDSSGRIVATECQVIVGYTGYIELFNRAGVVCIARAVCENDEWKFWFDEEGDHYRHVPAEGDRGKDIRYYAVATLPAGQRMIHVLSASDVEAHRARSMRKDRGPWKTDYRAMALKTVVRDMARWVPKATEVRDALEVDRYEDYPAVVVPPDSIQPTPETAALDVGEYEDPDVAMPGEPHEALL
jgi:recombination protein RecT